MHPRLEPSRAGSLSLVAGVVALDFVNTISGRGGAAAVEHLREPKDVLAWARHAKVMEDGGVGPPPPVLLERALVLRERLHRIAAALATGEPAPHGDLESLAMEHSGHLADSTLAAATGRYVWRWSSKRNLVAAILGPVTLSAITLLTEGDLGRLRVCPGHDCGWLFYDTSKAGRRRWCDMEVCGNRAKLRAFRRRQGHSGSHAG